jgi:hypothetical protein
MTGFPTNSGRKVQREWSIPALQTRFHKNGNFYMPLTKWPGALADPAGYIVFQNEDDLKKCPTFCYYGLGSVNLRIGMRGGIAQLPNYVRKRQPPN